MVPNTAVGLLLSGLSLWELRKHKFHQSEIIKRQVGKALAVIVLILGTLTLAEYSFGWDAGIDRILFQQALTGSAASFPGRPPPHTAVTFIFAALALLLLDFETERGYRPAQILAVLTAVVPLLALMGHVTEARVLYGISSGPGMAVHTVAAFVLLACGLLFNPRDPEAVSLLRGESVGTVLTRRLLVTSVAMSVVLGSFRLIGERAGFYDRELAVSIMVLAFFASFIWATSSYLTRADAERKLAQEALRESEEIYRAVVENVADGILINVGSTRRFVNKAFLRIHGLKDVSEVIGRPSDLFVVPEEKALVSDRTLHASEARAFPRSMNTTFAAPTVSCVRYRRRRSGSPIRGGPRRWRPCAT